MPKEYKEPKEPQKDTTPFNIHITDDVEGGTFANMVSVHASKDVLFIDFGIALPGKSPLTIKTVARMIVPHGVGQQVTQAIQTATLQLIEAQKQ